MQPLWRSRTDGGSVECIGFSPNGTLLAAGDRDGVIRVWDVETGRELYSSKGHKKWIHALTFSADGRILASCGHDRTVRLWESTTGALLGWLAVDSSWSRAFSRHRGLSSDTEDDFERDYVAGTWFLSVAISPDNHWIAAGTDEDSWFGRRIYL